MDDFGFVEAVDDLGEGVVVAVADAADRGITNYCDSLLGSGPIKPLA
jgi:hypothetical protein